MEISEKMQKQEQRKKLVERYRQYLKLEKSLSNNTLDAYLSDLDKLMSFLLLEGIEPTETCPADLERFLAGLHDIGIHARSQARILSGIKAFFHFLLISNYIESDPCELLEGPKIGFKLPPVLSVEEIDSIIAAIDLSKPEGQRNRAILETLYSCGLRVSELVNLKLSELYFNEGFIKVEGKGNKQRLVPISSRAIQEITLTHHDLPHDQGTGTNSRYHQKHQSTYIPALFCHPPAGRRCQPPCHPKYAWTRIHHHDRNLHTYRP